jgi:hypothetical protein
MKILFNFCLLLLSSLSLIAASDIKMLQLPGNSAKASDIAVDISGQVHATWLQDGDVFYALSPDRGETFGTPLRVNPEKEPAIGGMFRGPQLSLGRDGTVHLIWYPDQAKLSKSDWGVRYARLLKGAARFSDPINLGRRPSDSYFVASDGKGQVDVIWTADGAFVAHSGNDGESFESPQKISGLDPCECCGTSAFYDVNGKLALLYRDRKNNQRNVYIVTDVLGSASNKVQLNEENWEINACPMTGHSLVMLPGGGFVAGWELKGEAFVSISSSQAAKGTQILLGKGKYPKVLGLADGTVFASWKKGKILSWKTFDALGKETGSSTAGNASFPDKFGAAVSGPEGILLSP